MDEMPYCLAMMLCDQVYREPTTKKATILGSFDSLFFKTPPFNAHFCVYVSLTDGRGEVELNLKIRHCESDFSEDQSNDVALPEKGIKVAFQNPLDVVEAVFVVNNTFTKPGVYFCELYAGEERIMFRRLTVKVNDLEQHHGN